MSSHIGQMGVDVSGVRVLAVLGVAACSLGVVSIVASRTPDDGAAAPVLAELFEPVEEGPCAASEPTLRAVMADQIGPELSKVSFLLHHDRRESGERLGELHEHASVLVGCARVAAAFPPAARQQYTSHFLGQLELMREDAIGLQQAALMGNESSALHWFEHLRARCDGCHAFFIAKTEGE